MTWVQVEKTNRCENCGAMVTRSWCYYATAKTATHVLCEPCVEKLIHQTEGATL